MPPKAGRPKRGIQGEITVKNPEAYIILLNLSVFNCEQDSLSSSNKL